MKQTEEDVYVHAKVIQRQKVPYENVAKGMGIPVKDPYYVLEFETEAEVLSFEVSPFEYEVVEDGEEGELHYRKKRYCNELISFSDKIKEFHM